MSDTKTAAAPATDKPDNGLGLTGFIDSIKVAGTNTLTPPPAEKAPSAPNPDKEMGKEPAKAESKPADAPKPDASPSVKPAETKPEAKVEGKDSAKPPTDPKVEQLQKDLKKANDWAARERKRNDDLVAKLSSVETELKKLNGTHVEPKPVPVEEIAREVAMGERFAASYEAAVAIYGEDEVKALVLDEHAPYRELEKGDPAVAARVVNAKLPVVEAVKAIKEAQQRAKYGSDPDTMRAKLLEELITSPPKELLEAVAKKVAGQAPKANGVEIPATLGDVRGLSREESAKSAMPAIDAVVNKVFSGFKQTVA